MKKKDMLGKIKNKLRRKTEKSIFDINVTLSLPSLLTAPFLPPSAKC